MSEARLGAVGEAVYVGLDLGGTKVFGALVGADGEVHAEIYAEHDGGVHRTPAPGGAAAPPASGPPYSEAERALGPAYPCLVETAARLLDRARAAGQRPVGVGVGAPGLTRTDGVVVLAGGLAWRDVPLGAVLSRRLGLPVRVENDANLAALGEHAVGAGRGTRSMFLVTLGTAVGGAVVIDGKLWRGRHFGAGEIGAMLPGREYMGWDSREIGALETHAAGAGMAAEARRLAAAAGAAPSEAEASGERLFAAAAAGVPWARQVVDRAVDLWTVLFSAVQSILDPEVIVISGGMTHSAAGFLPEIARRLGRALPSVSPIVPSRLGYRASVLGVPALFAEVGGDDT
jgi:glucokinase